MNEYNMELINIKLSQIHNDILALHLCMTINKMYEVGLISKEEYTKMLNKEHEIITEQIGRTAKKM